MSSRYTAAQVQQRFGLELHDDENLLNVYLRYGIVFLRTLFICLLLLAPTGPLVWWAVRPRHFDDPPGLWVLVPTAIYALSILAYLVYKFIDWRNDALILTDQRLVHIEQTILFAQDQHETALSRVQNMNFDVRGLFPRLLNYGHIYIETAARGTDISFGPIRRPSTVQGEIMGRVQRLRATTSAELMRQTLLYRLDPDNNPRPDVPTGEERGPRRPRRLRVRLLPPNPLRVGNTIAWHKHGYFLFLRLLRSSALLLGLAGIAYFLIDRRAPLPFWLLWGVGFLIIAGYFVVQYQLWLGDIYVVTTDRIQDIYRTPFGLLGETRRSAPLERIQNISYTKPGLIPNLLNYGDVSIQTAGAGDLTFDHVPRPEEVQSEIYRRQELSRLQQEQHRREEIAEWLLTYRQLDQELEHAGESEGGGDSEAAPSREGNAALAVSQPGVLGRARPGNARNRAARQSTDSPGDFPGPGP